MPSATVAPGAVVAPSYFDVPAADNASADTLIGEHTDELGLVNAFALGQALAAQVEGGGGGEAAVLVDEVLQRLSAMDVKARRELARGFNAAPSEQARSAPRGAGGESRARLADMLERFAGVARLPAGDTEAASQTWGESLMQLAGADGPSLLREASRAARDRGDHLIATHLLETAADLDSARRVVVGGVAAAATGVQGMLWEPLVLAGRGLDNDFWQLPGVRWVAPERAARAQADERALTQAAVEFYQAAGQAALDALKDPAQAARKVWSGWTPVQLAQQGAPDTGAGYAALQLLAAGQLVRSLLQRLPKAAAPSVDPPVSGTGLQTVPPLPFFPLWSGPSPPAGLATAGLGPFTALGHIAETNSPSVLAMTTGSGDVSGSQPNAAPSPLAGRAIANAVRNAIEQTAGPTLQGLLNPDGTSVFPPGHFTPPPDPEGPRYNASKEPGEPMVLIVAPHLRGAAVGEEMNYEGITANGGRPVAVLSYAPAGRPGTRFIEGGGDRPFRGYFNQDLAQESFRTDLEPQIGWRIQDIDGAILDAYATMHGLGQGDLPLIIYDYAGRLQMMKGELIAHKPEPWHMGPLDPSYQQGLDKAMRWMERAVGGPYPFGFRVEREPFNPFLEFPAKAIPDSVRKAIDQITRFAPPMIVGREFDLFVLKQWETVFAKARLPMHEASNTVAVAIAPVDSIIHPSQIGPQASKTLPNQVQLPGTDHITGHYQFRDALAENMGKITTPDGRFRHLQREASAAKELADNTPVDAVKFFEAMPGYRVEFEGSVSGRGGANERDRYSVQRLDSSGESVGEPLRLSRQTTDHSGTPITALATLELSVRKQTNSLADLLRIHDPDVDYLQALTGESSLLTYARPDLTQFTPDPTGRFSSALQDQGIPETVLSRAASQGFLRYVEGGFDFVGYRRPDGTAEFAIEHRFSEEGLPLTGTGRPRGRDIYPPILYGPDPTRVVIVDSPVDALLVQAQGGETPPTVVVSHFLTGKALYSGGPSAPLLQAAERVSVPPVPQDVPPGQRAAYEARHEYLRGLIGSEKVEVRAEPMP